MFLIDYLIFQSFYRVLQTVFTSAACLNASFLNKNDHYGTSNRYPGIDLKQARQIFDILVKTDTSIINQVHFNT
jgi:hypothetical protein